MRLTDWIASRPCNKPIKKDVMVDVISALLIIFATVFSLWLVLLTIATHY